MRATLYVLICWLLHESRPDCSYTDEMLVPGPGCGVKAKPYRSTVTCRTRMWKTKASEPAVTVDCGYITLKGMRLCFSLTFALPVISAAVFVT